MIKHALIPLLRRDFVVDTDQTAGFASRLVEECHRALEIVLPLSNAELEFLDRLLEYGEIRPDLLTSDEELAARIRCHPLLEWKALNVRQHRRK